MKSKEAYKTIGEVCDIVGLIDFETGKENSRIKILGKAFQ